MPSVRPNESRDDYISRCVPVVLKEQGTKSRDHAVAKCNGMWEQVKKTENSLLPVPQGIQVLKVNAFCPTGKGGGVDPTCSPGKSIRGPLRRRNGYRYLSPMQSEKVLPGVDAFWGSVHSKHKQAVKETLQKLLEEHPLDGPILIETSSGAGDAVARASKGRLRQVSEEEAVILHASGERVTDLAVGGKSSKTARYYHDDSTGYTLTLTVDGPRGGDGYYGVTPNKFGQYSGSGLIGLQHKSDPSITAKMVVIHEYGHFLTYKAGYGSKEIQNRPADKDIAKRIGSGYALKNWAETVAEAYLYKKIGGEDKVVSQFLNDAFRGTSIISNEGPVESAGLIDGSELVEEYLGRGVKRINSTPTITSLTATDSNGNEFSLPKSAITNELVQSLTTNATVRPNPLLMDPTGTGKERKALERAIMSRLKVIKRLIVEMLVTEDVFGLKNKPVVYTSNLSSTQVNITDPNILTAILDIQNRIDLDDLVEFEDKSHITIRYGLHDLDPKRVEWIISQHSSVRAKLGGLSIFPAKEPDSQRGGPEFDVLKIDVSSKDLESINRHLGILPNTTTHPDYHPHLTIAYLKPGTGQKYVGESGLEGVELEFKSMVYSDDDRKKAEMVFNAFCPTGKGGGVDPSCGKGKDGVKGQSTLKREPSGVDTLVDVAGYRLTALRNPSVEQAVGLLQKLQKEAEGDPFKFAELRALSDGKNIWIWSGGAVLHDTAADALGLDYRRLAGGGGLLKMKEEGTVRFFFHRYKETGSYLSDGNFITINAGIWEFVTDDQKVEEFIKWIRSQMSVAVLGTMTTLGTTDPDHWLMKHIQDTYTKGMGKVFEFIRKPIFAEKMPHYEGTKAEFLKSAFTRPVSPNRVKLLAGRAYSELSGMTDKMATQMQRSLTDGFIRGESPRDIARQLVKDVDGLGRKQANMIASTEITRAYNEGQLDSMEELGVEDVGVSVEWRVSKQGVTVLGNPSPCPVCAPLNGIVLKISEARGLLPRHPHCRCAWVASGVGESTKGQKRSQQRIVQAVKSSLLAERPKRKKTTAKPSRWAGSKAKIGKNRPKSILD